MIEKLDVYDKEKKRTGKIIERKQGVTRNKGEYVISVQCWIVNSEGKMLLTQRSLNKTHGGMWEPTGGLVISGETSKQGIKRELKEEIGLDIDDDKIELIKEIVKDSEVMDAKYVTIEEFSKMIENNEAFDWLDYFKELFK